MRVPPFRRSTLDSVIYNGQSIPKEHFRVFLFNQEGNKILVNNWEQYESLIESGEWFDELPKPIEHANKNRKKVSKHARQGVDGGVQIVEEDGNEVILV